MPVIFINLKIIYLVSKMIKHMKFNKNLAAIHAYLCGDGYVVKNPLTQKHTYYRIGLRNTNITLLKDFQEKFTRVFGIRPILTFERCQIGNRKIYESLTENESYYSYEWELPQLSRENLKSWLRAFFDCEGWVENKPGKSRLIGLECCNATGLKSVQQALMRFGIRSQIKKRPGRTIWRLTICGLDNLNVYSKNIGFVHPTKKQKLTAAIDSYKSYWWQIPTTKSELLEFVMDKGKLRKSRQLLRLLSIKRDNLEYIKKALNKHHIHSKLFGPWKNNTGSLYYCLTISMTEVNTWKEQVRQKS